MVESAGNDDYDITCGVSATAGTGHEGNFSCPGPYLIDFKLDESLIGGAGGGELSSLNVCDREDDPVALTLTGAKFKPD